MAVLFCWRRQDTPSPTLPMHFTPQSPRANSPISPMLHTAPTGDMLLFKASGTSLALYKYQRQRHGPPEHYSHIGTIMTIRLRVLGTRVLLLQGTLMLGPSTALPEHLPMGSGVRLLQLTEEFSRSRGEVSSSASMMVSKGDRVSSSVLSRISVMAVNRDSSFCASKQALLCCKGRDSLRG